MAKNKFDSQTVSTLIERIIGDDLHLIDFDEVSKELLHLCSALEQSEHYRNELNQLREDYQNRIAGMVKAITAVERKQNDTEDTIAYLENLVELSAAELIAEYRKTSARFRSAFPTTFGPLNSHTNRHSRLKNPEVFK